MISISHALSRLGDGASLLRLASPVLALSAASVTVAYYQVHGPALQLLVGLSLVWLFLRWRSAARLELCRLGWGLVAIFLAYVLMAILSAAGAGFNAAAVKRLGNFSIFLAAGVLLPFLVAAKPRANWFWPAIAMTALLSGAFAGWEVLTLRDSFEASTGMDFRAGGSKGKQIPFGDISALAAVLSLLAASVNAGSRRWVAGLFVVAAIAGGYASIASGTRAAWVFFPTGVLLVCLYLVQQYPASRRFVLSGLLALLLLGGLALAQSQSVQSRFATAVTEIESYRPGQTGQGGNSMGERFEMWRAAWGAFQSHPWLGIGVGQLNAYFKAEAEQGRISRAIAEFDRGNGHTHAHNDYIHALATRGLLGLSSLLLLYLVPLAVFVRAAGKAVGAMDRGVAYAGILTILAYMQYSLTDSVLMMRITGGFFVLLLVWLLALTLERSPVGSRSGDVAKP